MFTSMSVSGNLHEAVDLVNKMPPAVQQHVHQFVQQIHGIVGVVFWTPSREDTAVVRSYLNQNQMMPKES
jgi:sensor histidine kinase regulating citrate/malate metabolism